MDEYPLRSDIIRFNCTIAWHAQGLKHSFTNKFFISFFSQGLSYEMRTKTNNRNLVLSFSLGYCIIFTLVTSMYGDRKLSKLIMMHCMGLSLELTILYWYAYVKMLASIENHYLSIIHIRWLIISMEQMKGQTDDWEDTFKPLKRNEPSNQWLRCTRRQGIGTSWILPCRDEVGSCIDYLRAAASTQTQCDDSPKPTDHCTI